MSEIEIKDGDIFHWRWRDEKRNADYLSYWAKSCIAVARGGKLLDTFSDYAPVLFSYEEALRGLTLTYVANFADLDKQPEYLAAYYDDADCVNLNHSNSSKGNFYIRKGAVRSANKMKATINSGLEKEMSAIRVGQARIERLEKALADICRGCTLENIYL